jgi:CRAL/TRIO domain
MNQITTDERMLQNLVTEYEKMADPRLPACSRKAGHLLETSCTIMDAKGVGVTSIPSVYGYLQRASAVSQDYYPERLGKMYIVNAPWGFATAWSVIKKFLDPVTINKIHILGSNYKSELLAQVPEENLPKALGGACECPGGCQLSDDGPWKDPQWARPPKWARGEENAIKDTGATSGAEGVEEGIEADEKAKEEKIEDKTAETAAAPA